MRPRQHIRQRFESKYIPEPTSGCWLWIGSHNNKQYGTIAKGEGTKIILMAHRVSWEINRGPIPEDMCVLHRCDNTFCVNPDHLFLGTLQDNTRDSVTKGRWNRPRGEQHYQRKLTEEKVREIRASTLGDKELSERFGISVNYVWQIKTRKWWKHVI